MRREALTLAKAPSREQGGNASVLWLLMIMMMVGRGSGSPRATVVKAEEKYGRPGVARQFWRQDRERK
jgi:hypothetical protein